MLAVITIMLVVLAALNAIFTTWATVTDARRASALMRALGARARQVSSGLVVTQVLSALPGAIAGIPLGILLFRAAVKGGSLPPAPWLAGTVLGTLLVMAGLTLVPARIGARQPVAEVLQIRGGLTGATHEREPERSRRRHLRPERRVRRGVGHARGAGCRRRHLSRAFASQASHSSSGASQSKSQDA